jgi:cytochrome P450
MLSLLFLAGHETTSGLLTNGALALLRHPDQLSAVSARPELMEPAVEEMLRYDPSLNRTFPAMARETFELGGTTTEAGDVVTVYLPAMGMNPEVNEDPDRFGVIRHGAHLAFGHGVHHCLGAPLARLEARIAFRALLDHLPGLELAGDDLERVPSTLFNLLSPLPVRRRL